jgi:hypothetical protein
MKIPCFIFIFNNYKEIIKSIDCFVGRSDALDIFIVENRSIYTDECIKPYVMEKIKDNTIKKYYLFNENITNNALEVALIMELRNWLKHEYIIITDGDLFIDNKDWLSEQVNILKKNPNVFACGISLDTKNLPLSIPGAENWIGKPFSINDCYIDTHTGVWSLMLKSKNFKLWLKHMLINNLKIEDSKIVKFATKINKRWAATKNSKAIHLTWDVYEDKSNPYLNNKINLKFNIWDHNKISELEVYTIDTQTKVRFLINDLRYFRAINFLKYL